MKSILKLCAICLIVAFTGCESTDSDASMDVSPGAISECGVNCECCPGSANYKADDASLGAVTDDGTCSSAPAPATCSSPEADASLGAVSEGTCSGAAKTCSKSDG